ncbi:MAG: hypothetical protein ACKOUR_04330, partial [Planctomycetota bacterium]
LYSSLSTDYSADFSDDSAVAYPLGKADSGTSVNRITETRPLRVQRDAAVHLKYFLVRSI